MERKKFDIHVSDGELLRRNENHLKYINGFSEERKNRSTWFDYAKVPVLRYHIYDGYEELVHGFSTRLGGVSRKHLASMNLSYSRGDEPERVTENHRRLGEAMGYDYERLVFSDQIHDVKIRVVTEADAGKGITKKTDYEGVDGLLTNVRHLPLITFYADCVPLYFYDPEHHAVALAHSGWKGTVRRIGSLMAERMHAEYGSMPESILCAIGPSICMGCYEVSEDVAEQFRSAYSEVQCAHILRDKGEGKYLLDLHGACRYNFLDAGIREENIALPDLCTCCNSRILFSHRASGGMRGNLGAVIMLKG